MFVWRAWSIKSPCCRFLSWLTHWWERAQPVIYLIIPAVIATSDFPSRLSACRCMSEYISLPMPVTHFYPSLARVIVPPGKKEGAVSAHLILSCKQQLEDHRGKNLSWLPLLSWADCLAQCLQKGAKLYIPSPKNRGGTAAQLLLLCGSLGRAHFQASSYSNYKVALHSQEPRKKLSLHVVKKNL